MSDHEEERPLTRRERRLQEMAATGALDLSEVVENPAGQPAPVQEAADTADGAEPSAEEIEISPVNEDGTPRSRREIRQLREEALARLEANREPAAAEPADETPAETAPEDEASRPAEDESARNEPVREAPVEADAAPEETPVDEPETAEDPDPAPAEAEATETVEVPEAEADAVADFEPEAVEPADAIAVQTEEAAAEPEADEEPAPATVAFDASDIADAESRTPAVDAAPEERIDFDTLISPPTEAFTVEELAEAESANAAAANADPEDVLADGAPVEEALVDGAAEAEATDAGKPKRRFPWKRNKAGEGDAPAEDAADGEPSASEPVAEPATGEAEAADELSAPAPATSPTEPEVAQPAAEAEPEPVSSETAQTYSFPDIAPPEEWRSVFDDPTPRTLSGQKADGDFDDLISRAVAQESTTSSNTSALILPTMPEDTGGLTGPLGATGDMYVTGSLKLPKSLGETGGHSALHDSVEVDPISGMPEDDPQVTAEQTGLAPVAARHAVSAQVTSSIPVVAKPVKDRNKLPLVLSLTGGGLLVVVAGIGVVGATQGWFG